MNPGDLDQFLKPNRFKMVYLGTSITAGNRGSVEFEQNGASNGHNSEVTRSSTENRDDRDGNESSGDEEREGQIRVGKDYQISPPDWISPERKFD